MKDLSLSVKSMGNKMFRAVARSFPVSCASDEFCFFPHIKLKEEEWNTWDQFTEESVFKTSKLLFSCEKKLDSLKGKKMDFETETDIRLLVKFSRTLREQLSLFRFWEKQPTLYLTIVCKGLEEALNAKDPNALIERVSTLPDFLLQASENLLEVPLTFHELGVEMVSDVRNFFELIAVSVPEMKHSLNALAKFEKELKNTPIVNDKQMPNDMAENLVRYHYGSEMDFGEIELMLDQEIEEMNKILNEESAKFIRKYHLPGRSTWQTIYNFLPQPHRQTEKMGTFSDQVEMLRDHCLSRGLVSRQLVNSCPVLVATMPPYLKAIRTASSYSISPDQPPQKGTFYILNNNASLERLCEFRMLSAHETYPGHHLLDSSRLNLKRSCRRSVEQPIFYEGWACFAEELMRITGKFKEPGDRLILAKRRLWRAVRGKVDLGLLTGNMDLAKAAKYMSKMIGTRPESSMSSLKKYTLNPGYQLCYTLGIRKFQDLYDKYGQNDIPRFVKTVLGQGEIGFTDLENYLNTGSA